MSKVLNLLKSTPSVEAKSVAYEARVKENLYKTRIQPILDKIREIETQIEDQLDFSLDTDMNRGISAISRPEVEKRLDTVMTLKYQLGVQEMELKLTMAGFNELFDGEGTDEVLPIMRRTRAPKNTVPKAEAVAGDAVANTGTPEY
jgi:hypothetical protein